MNGEWISVKDELPEGRVLICYLEPFFGEFTEEIGVGYYDNPADYEDPNDGEGWKFWLGDRNVVGGGVTHWMKLPEVPKAT